MKQLLKILSLSIFLSTNLFFINAQHILTINDVDFDSSTGTINDYHGIYTDIVIPHSFEIDGKVNYITAIRYSAFYSNNLTSVTISEGVETIGDGAFCLNKIVNINIPSSVKYIGSCAFNNNLIAMVNGELSNGIFYSFNNGSIDSTKIISYGGASKIIDFIPSKVKTIGSAAFYDCEISKVTLPPELEIIETAAFSFNNIEEIVIPTSVNFINERAFFYNKLSSAIVLPSPVINDTATFVNWKDSYGLVVTDIFDPLLSYSAHFFKNEPEYPEINMISYINTMNSPEFVFNDGLNCNSYNTLDVTINLEYRPVTLDYVDVNIRSIHEPYNIVSSKRVFFRTRDGILFTFEDGRERVIKRNYFSLYFNMEDLTENQLYIEALLYGNGQLKGNRTVSLSEYLFVPYIWEEPSVSTIKEGEPLQNAILSGGRTSVCGQFIFKNPELTPPSGSYEAVLQFIPTRSGIYSIVESSVTVNVEVSTDIKFEKHSELIIYHDLNMVHINVEQEQILDISVYGSSGNLISCFKGNRSSEQKIDLSNYITGVYLIKVSTTKNVIVKKILL